MRLSILLPLLLPQADLAGSSELHPQVTWSLPGCGSEHGILCPGYLPGFMWNLARVKSGALSGISETEVRFLLQAFSECWEEKLLHRFYREPDVQYLPCLFRKGGAAGISVCLYSGVVQAPQSGIFRFVGRGGDVMAVRFGERVVLHASGGETVGQAVRVETGKLYLLEWLVAEWNPGAAQQSLHTEWTVPGEKSVRYLFKTADCPAPEAGEAPVWNLFHTTRDSL